MILTSCNRDKYYSGEKNLEIIKGYNNKNYYPSGKMDSLQAISYITIQKLQEVYDLSVLAYENKANKDIDTLIFTQLKGYFSKNDTLYAQKIVNTMDSLQVKYVKLELIKSNNSDSLIQSDSIGTVRFNAYYYDKNKKKFIEKERQANYILKKNPEKFKAEFKFYFTYIGNFDSVTYKKSIR
jgi:hypothetical protein